MPYECLGRIQDIRGPLLETMRSAGCMRITFDVGTGSVRNLSALMIPYEYLTKVFLSHLHTDHWGGLASLWAGGWTAGRPGPLQVWGPSGLHPELGTKSAMEGFLKFVAWDKETRSFQITPEPGNVIVHEFDYKIENQVVYDEDGVVVKSFPAIHTGDGPVSYTVEYEGMRVVFGGDTAPNKWGAGQAVNPPNLFYA